MVQSFRSAPELIVLIFLNRSGSSEGEIALMPAPGGILLMMLNACSETGRAR